MNILYIGAPHSEEEEFVEIDDDRPKVPGNVVVHEIPLYGFLKYNRIERTLTAQCLEHEVESPTCQRSLTCKKAPNGRGPQGRPVGALMAWLLNAADKDNRADHCWLGQRGKRQSDADARRMNWESRKTARALLTEIVGPAEATIIFNYERGKRDNEPHDEPEGLCQ